MIILAMTVIAIPVILAFALSAYILRGGNHE